jgi:methionyl-tRNA formyltransferase
MRLIFMGTPDFAAHALQALILAGEDILAVYTQPPRPAKRGQQPHYSAVHTLARAHNIPVYTPVTLKDADVQQSFKAHNAHMAVVAAYGLILPSAILAAPDFGCLNIHASLLPRWRGAAPIQRAIQAGDVQTGVCIMQMEAGLDTGPVLLEEATPILPAESAGVLQQRLSQIGARLIVQAVQNYTTLTPRVQAHAMATYAHKIDKQEARLDWTLSAYGLVRQIQAFNPVPGCYFDYAGERIKILAATAWPNARPEAPPGLVLDQDLTIACGDSTCLKPDLVQRAGKRAMPVGQMLRGLPIPAGVMV